MANVYHPADASRAGRVDALFARIASRYDFINDLQSFGLHRLWKSRVVRLAGPRAGTRALDLCCGTGDIAFALAREGASVVGLDFNAAMLAVAHRRAKKRSTQASVSGAPEFIRGDALHIPFADNSFDMITIGYGLRNLTDWKAGLREMLRVAKPGAPLIALDFGKPSNALWRSAYFMYLRLCVPLFGLLFCRDAAAYAYILESLKEFPAQRGIEREMRAIGCIDTRVIEPLGGVMGLNVGVKAQPAMA